MLKNFIIVAIAAFVLSSCAHTIYPVESMYNNYQSQMRSVDELEIKSKVQIYFNEKDIKSDYTVFIKIIKLCSFNGYRKLGKF